MSYKEVLQFNGKECNERNMEEEEIMGKDIRNDKKEDEGIIMEEKVRG